jgi:hypothetical protein
MVTIEAMSPIKIKSDQPLYTKHRSSRSLVLRPNLGHHANTACPMSGLVKKSTTGLN